MEKISLEEQKILNKIIDVSTSVVDVYQKLSLEEINYGNQTNNYETLMNKLTELKNKEDDLYEKLKLNPSKVDMLIEFFMVTEKPFFGKENNVLNAIEIFDYKCLYPYRIINKLENRIFEDNKERRKWLLDNGYFVFTKDANKFIKFKNIEETIKKDFEAAFLFYLDEELEKSDNMELSKSLARVKYNLCFISEEAEKEFIRAKYSNNDFLYFTFPFAAEINQIDNEICENIQFESVRNYCAEAMKHILIRDGLIDDDFQVDFILFSTYMKSGLSLIFQLEDYDYLIQTLEEEINTINDDTNNSLEKSSQFLVSMIRNIELEKPKCKYLHYIPQK